MFGSFGKCARAGCPCHPVRLTMPPQLFNLHDFFTAFHSYPWWQVGIEWVLIGTVVYWVVRFLQGTRGARLLKGIVFLLITLYLIVTLFGERFGLQRIQYPIRPVAAVRVVCDGRGLPAGTPPRPDEARRDEDLPALRRPIRRRDRSPRRVRRVICPAARSAAWSRSSARSRWAASPRTAPSSTPTSPPRCSTRSSTRTPPCTTWA